MNRAKRYSGLFTLTVAVLSFGLGLYLAWPLKPEIRVVQVVQSPNHAGASLSPIGIIPGSILTAADFNRHVASVCPKAGLQTYETGDVVPTSDLLRCIVSAAMAATYNRDSRSGAVTPHPYALHPDKTPIIDPTQDAYYRQLLKEGRFPTTGSSEGRPK